MFTLTVKMEFAGAHNLRGYEGSCERLHGHNWKVEVAVEGKELDGIGILVDFKEIKSKLREHLAVYEHRYLNEIAPFDSVNPSAENLARQLYKDLAALLDRPGARVARVTIWETEQSGCTYEE